MPLIIRKYYTGRIAPHMRAEMLLRSLSAAVGRILHPAPFGCLRNFPKI